VQIQTTLKILFASLLGLSFGFVLFCAIQTGEQGESASESLSDDKHAAAASQPSEANKSNRRRAIDAHTHLSRGAFEVLPSVLREVNVRRVVNLSGGRSPEGRKRTLKASSEISSRVAHFANVSWQGVNRSGFGQRTAVELEKAVRSGFAGLKIHKALGLSVKDKDGNLLPVDTPILDPLWEKAGELGIPVTIHTADPKAFFKKPDKNNERYKELKLRPSWSFYGSEYPARKKLLKQRDRLLKQHADTTFILAHFGNNPENLDYVENLLEKYDNIYLDTSARIAEIGRHDRKEVRELFIEHADRIIFGTDLGLQARRRDGDMYYSLMLGSVSKKPPAMEDIPPFYKDHWRFFESDEPKIEHPVPIQGDWKVHPISLPESALTKLYWKNAERVIFAPHFGRQNAYGAIRTAKRSAK
jgi:predicted TIM-barrel fold metal-dependent hydrolase